MKAGRELDVLIAEKFFGQTRKQHEENFGCPTCGYDGLYDEPCYSTDIAAAWMVVDKIKNQNILVEINLPFGDTHYVCQFFEFDAMGESRLRKMIGGAGSDSMPHAICLAALRAVGVEV